MIASNEGGSMIASNEGGSMMHRMKEEKMIVSHSQSDLNMTNTVLYCTALQLNCFC